MRVLIVEDDQSVVRTLEKQLRKLGHASEHSPSIVEIVSGETELEPDVIITDIFMPKVEGLETIRILKKSALRDVPIVAISGGGSNMGGIPDVEKSFVATASLAFGAVEFLPKPISLGALSTALKKCEKLKTSPQKRINAA